MKVRITTQYGEFTAELDEGQGVHDQFPPDEPTTTFTVMSDDGHPVRVTMRKSLVRIAEEDL